MSIDVHGGDVAAVALRFFHESAFPLQVADNAFFLAGTESGGEIEQGVLSGESLLEHLHVFGVFAEFVDGHKTLAQSRQVEQYVVDGEQYVGTYAAHFGDKRHAVHAAERVVAHNHRVDGGRRDVFGIHYLHLHVKLRKDGLREIRTELVAVFVNKVVDFIDMEQTSNPSYHELGQPAVQTLALGFYHLVQIDETLANLYIFGIV